MPDIFDSSPCPRLSRIETPADLRKFDEAELPAIADELRAYLIESVGKSVGHFGAGLGVIELTVALPAMYDTPDDRIVRDVGHQLGSAYCRDRVGKNVVVLVGAGSLKKN